ncbi:hypothetical protein T492DRAFT_832014 [Pavlovales sp. CCMP2436]|nr:hypothetical protein T492DRAFT_832014 [Pavlovales sp. CCMP2436]
MAYEDYQSPPTKTRRQMQLEGINMGLTSDELRRISKMSDLRTRPAKSPQDENNQISRLMSNEIILQKIIQRYGNLDTKGGRDAVGIVFGVHNKTIDKLMTMRRTGGILMSNVYGALESTGMEVTIDPYATVTSAVTQLSFSSLETPQNQTRDLTKILKKKLPVAIGNDELVYLRADSAANFHVVLTWHPDGCSCKVEAMMSPAVVHAGFTQSFGHAALSFDSDSGKYVASFIASADYGIFNNGIYYEVDRYSGSNASKINLGLNTSTTLNVFWNLNMPLRPFANVASCNIEITRNPEGASSISFYNQIYKPVIRICGGSIVSNAYNGIVKLKTATPTT